MLQSARQRFWISQRSVRRVLVLIAFLYSIHLLLSMRRDYKMRNAKYLSVLDPRAIKSINRVNLDFSSGAYSEYTSEDRREIGHQLELSEHCRFGCSYFNPTVIRYAKDIWLVAVRESQDSNCGGPIGTWLSMAKKARSKVSSVVVGQVIGSVPEFNRGSLESGRDQHIKVRPLARLQEADRRTWQTKYFGHEDPRWVVDQGFQEDGWLNTFIISPFEKYGEARMHLTKIDVIQRDQTGDNNVDNSQKSVILKSREPLLLWPFEGEPMKQKNWLHMPVHNLKWENVCWNWRFKDVARDKNLLFVYSLAPLVLMWVDTITGNSTMMFRNHLLYHDLGLGDRLLGSSALIPLQADDDIYRQDGEVASWLAMAHWHLLTQKSLVYVSHFVRISMYTQINAEDGTTDYNWRLSHMSRHFTLPYGSDSRLSHSISYPTTLQDGGDVFYISVGDSDCESLLFTMDKRYVMNMLYKVQI
ncbi:hypothetical protein MIR68_010878 [Amoeboaphelidium protococcarum]|nr:hypothetical protein MIR68_010878 [Amoeboaphelidium protococcarum]